MAQRNYVVSTTALSLSASGTTVGSGNTQASSFTVLRTFVRTGLSAGELDGSSQTWSFRFNLSATSGQFGSRFKFQRRNSGGTVQSESGYTTAREPISTGTYTDDVTWASGTWAENDQLAVVWEGYRTSGTGNKTGTLTVNGETYLDAPQGAVNFNATGSLTAQSAAVAGSGTVGRVSSGSLTAQSSTISGSAVVGRAASGELTAQSSSLAGSATVGRAATGSLEAGSSTISGSAGAQEGEDFPASGVLQAQSSTISGTVTVNRAASGSLIATPSSISGSGESTATPSETPTIRVIGRGRRSFVEIDGEIREVSGFEEAQRLLSEIKKVEKAQRKDRKRVLVLTGKPVSDGILYSQAEIQKIEQRIDDREARLASLYAMILESFARNDADFDDDEEVLLL